MSSRVSYWVYRAFRGLVKLFYPKPELIGAEQLPEGPCVIVGNHAQMHGPIVAELYLPGERSIWCNGEMMHLKEVPDYAFTDFWSGKPASVRWLYRILSYIIAPLSVCVFNNAHCIGVYRDARISSTFQKTLRRLSESARIVIFPEKAEPRNDILYAFQEQFIGLGRMYHRRTGQRLRFVPMYVAPALHRMVFGAPIEYDPEADPDAERRRISDALAEAITDLARSQPRHRVVPYLNLPKRQYPMNLPDEKREHEKTSR